MERYRVWIFSTRATCRARLRWNEKREGCHSELLFPHMLPKCICRWACEIRFASLFLSRITLCETHVGTRCVICNSISLSRGESLCRDSLGWLSVRARLRETYSSSRRFTRGPQILSFLDRLSRVRARSLAGVLATLSSDAYFLRQSRRRGSMQKTRPSRCRSRWTPKSASTLTSPRPRSLRLFFFLGRFSRLFCVYLRAVYGSR